MNFSLQQSKSHLKAVLIFFTRFFFKKLQQIGNLQIAGALTDARIFFLKNVNTPGRGAPLLISLLERHYDENIFWLETKDMNGCVWRVLIQGVISLQHSVQWNLRLDQFINSGANILGWSVEKPGEIHSFKWVPLQETSWDRLCQEAKRMPDIFLQHLHQPMAEKDLGIYTGSLGSSGLRQASCPGASSHMFYDCGQTK